MSNNTTKYKWFNYQNVIGGTEGIIGIYAAIFGLPSLLNLSELVEGGTINYIIPIIGVVGLIVGIVNVVKIFIRNKQLNNVALNIVFSILILIISFFIAITAIIDFLYYLGGKGEFFGILRRLKGQPEPVATGAPQDAVMDAYYESQNNNAYTTYQTYTENQEKAANYAGYSSAQEADKAGKLAQAEGTYESSAEKMLNM